MALMSAGSCSSAEYTLTLSAISCRGSTNWGTELETSRTTRSRKTSSEWRPVCAEPGAMGESVLPPISV